MSEKIELKIEDMSIKHFLSYQVDADLYTAADAFHMELSDPDIKITAGMHCWLKVNGQLELTGIIDKVQRKVNKSGVSLAVSGRDLMGIAVDSCCEKWGSVSGKTLQQLAEMLLGNVYALNRIKIEYQKNVVGKLKKSKKVGGGFLSGIDTPQKISQIEPGMKIFEVLQTYAASRGMLFYSLPDGTFVFGRPMTKGEPSYTLILRKDGIGNNVIESDVINDISRRYSKVTVVGQQQGQDFFDSATKINSPLGVAIDADFPFHKPYVTKNNNDSVSPQQHARMIMEKHRWEGLQLHYTVARHSQDKTNWTINQLCRVKDEAQDIDGVYLIYGRTFELSKDAGPITRLRLGLPGRVA